MIRFEALMRAVQRRERIRKCLNTPSDITATCGGHKLPELPCLIKSADPENSPLFLGKGCFCMCQSVAAPHLPETPAEVRSLDHLRHFVHITLCRKENLLENHFPMSELELLQNGRRCGYQFVLHGPRSVKLAAVWAESSNEVLLYDATGKRYGRIRLPHKVA